MLYLTRERTKCYMWVTSEERLRMANGVSCTLREAQIYHRSKSLQGEGHMDRNMRHSKNGRLWSTWNWVYRTKPQGLSRSAYKVNQAALLVARDEVWSQSGKCYRKTPSLMGSPKSISISSGSTLGIKVQPFQQVAAEGGGGKIESEAIS